MENLFKQGLQINSVLGIGDPIVDISAEIEKADLDKFGLAFGQTVFAEDKNIKFFEELEKKKEVSYVPGGSVQNSLRVISWCLRMSNTTDDQRKLTMLGCTGNDTYRQKILDALKEVGVNSLLQISEGESTSRCAAGILEKERCLLTEIKASNSLSDEYIEQNWEEICSHDCFLIEGYFIPKKYNMIKKIVNEFKAKKKPIVITLSAVFLLQHHKEKMVEIANDCNIIFCNMEECEALAGIQGKYYSDTIELAHKQLTPKRRHLIVTCGSKGVISSSYNYEQEHLDYIYQQFPKYILDEEMVDANGAGDAFLGGFVAQWMLGRSIVACAKGGNATSGVILRNVGCQFKNHSKFLDIDY